MYRKLWKEIDRIIDGLNFYLDTTARWYYADSYVNDLGELEYVLVLKKSNGHEHLIFSDIGQKSFVEKLIIYCTGFETGRKADY